MEGGRRKVLKIRCIARIRDLWGVLGVCSRTKNVPCVPSLLEPLFVSNGTGKRGVDPKDRVAHLRGVERNNEAGVKQREWAQRTE
jgi:hypothetical protein